MCLLVCRFIQRLTGKYRIRSLRLSEQAALPFTEITRVLHLIVCVHIIFYAYNRLSSLVH